MPASVISELTASMSAAQQRVGRGWGCWNGGQLAELHAVPVAEQAGLRGCREHCFRLVILPWLAHMRLVCLIMCWNGLAAWSESGAAAPFAGVAQEGNVV